LVEWSGELLDLSTVYSQVLQDVVHRVDKAFKRYTQGDSKGKRSGKPRFKGEARYRSLTYTQAKNDWLEGDYLSYPNSATPEDKSVPDFTPDEIKPNFI
jgi:putative transposase